MSREGDRIAGLDRRQRDGRRDEHQAGDQRAPARVAPGRVDREQDPHEERAGLRQRGGGEVRELDDDDGQRERDERRAPAPGQRGAEGQGGGEADRPDRRRSATRWRSRRSRARASAAAIRRSRVARRELPQRHRRRPYLRRPRRAIAPAGDVRAQDRSRERGEMACAGDVRRPRRWDRLRRRFQRSTGGRHEDPARHARRRDGGRRRRRAAGHRPGDAGHEDADAHERAGQGRGARDRHAAARGLGRRPLRLRLDPALGAASSPGAWRATASPSTSSSRACSARSPPSWPTARSRSRARR